MKSRRKKEEGRPSTLRSYKVMLPETYRRTRSPVWFEGTHLQVVQDREQGIVPIIYRGKEEAVMLDPRAIVFTPLDPRSSARWTTPRATQALDDHAPWAREWLLEHPHWGVPGCELDWERAITPAKKGQQGLE